MLHESVRRFLGDGDARLAAAALDAHALGPRPFDAESRARQSAAFPAEFAALERIGFAPGPLHAALAEAQRAGVAPFDALLASGAFEETTLVDALARAIGVDVVSPADFAAPAIDADTYALACATGHLCSIDEAGAPRFVVAARGLGVGRLAASRRSQKRTHAIALAAPRAFANLAVARAGAALAERAAEGPAAIAPELTVAHGLPDVAPVWRLAMVVAAVAVFVAAIAINAVATALLLLAGLLFAAMNLLRLVLAATPPADRRAMARPIPDADLPVYTVLVALYREAAVVPSLLDGLERLDYPRAKLDIKILVEAGDLETRAALRVRPPRAGIEVLAIPPGGPQTKPRALNAGLLCARGELLTIYDAEDRPEPRQLRVAAEAFRRAPRTLGCVQARLAIDNFADGWLVRHFAIEYAALFDVVLPALAALKLPIPLGGTSNHFRVSALRAVGGWDAGNVTEDADLGLRLARSGYETRTIDSVTWEEAPTTVWPWIKQRTRWMKGYLVTAFVHARRPAGLFRALGPCGFFVSQLVIAGVVLTALAYPFVVTAILVSDFTGALLAPASGLGDALIDGFHLFNLIIGFAAALGCGWMGIDRRCPPRLALDLVTLPVYWMLVGYAAWRALRQLAMGEASHWEKTAHGVSKRRATPQL